MQENDSGLLVIDVANDYLVGKTIQACSFASSCLPDCKPLSSNDIFVCLGVIMRSVSSFRYVAVAATLFLSSLILETRIAAQINVFLDYTDFQTRLNEATTDAGVTNFSSSETAQIQSNILNYLNTAFTGYSVNFTTSNPGGNFETLNFGLDEGGFGRADLIDFRNKSANDVGRIFTGNFGVFIDSGVSRSQQIMELSNSLSGTASHELGHNVGLEHRDPYGILGTFTANFNGGGVTGSLQNQSIMATSSNGLTIEQRKQVRTFSDISHVKLEFAQGVNPNALPVTAEQAAPHNSVGTAQQVEFSALNIGNSDYTHAAVVDGRIANGGEVDFYSFDMLEGDILTLQIQSDYTESDDIDSLLSLFDTNGSTLLARNDDTTYTGIGVNQDPSDPIVYSLDASIYHFEAVNTGTYFLQLNAISGTDLGNYELLFALSSPIPEPTSLSLAIGALGILLCRRRNKNIGA